MDVPKVGPLMGLAAGLVWRGFETWSQISFRNRVGCVPVHGAAWPCTQMLRHRVPRGWPVLRWSAQLLAACPWLAPPCLHGFTRAQLHSVALPHTACRSWWPTTGPAPRCLAVTPPAFEPSWPHAGEHFPALAKCPSSPCRGHLYTCPPLRCSCPARTHRNSLETPFHPAVEPLFRRPWTSLRGPSRLPHAD